MVGWESGEGVVSIFRHYTTVGSSGPCETCSCLYLENTAQVRLRASLFMLLSVDQQVQVASGVLTYILLSNRVSGVSHVAHTLPSENVDCCRYCTAPLFTVLSYIQLQ